MFNFSRAQHFRWKGKVVTEKFFKKKQQLVETGKARRKIKPPDEVADVSGSTTIKTDPDKTYEDFPVKGERLIDLEFLARAMKCCLCGEQLNLLDIKGESRRGLKSLLKVWCHSCLLMNNIPTGKQRSDDNTNLHFEANYKVAMGLIHAGIPFQAFDKLSACLDIPSMSSNTFQYYENKVGRIIEEVAQESCDKAIEIEKQLTIKNIEKIKKML